MCNLDNYNSGADIMLTWAQNMKVEVLNIPLKLLFAFRKDMFVNVRAPSSLYLNTKFWLE
jgi:hypothetical protein